MENMELFWIAVQHTPTYQKRHLWLLSMLYVMSSLALSKSKDLTPIMMMSAFLLLEVRSLNFQRHFPQLIWSLKMVKSIHFHLGTIYFRSALFISDFDSHTFVSVDLTLELLDLLRTIAAFRFKSG